MDNSQEEIIEEPVLKLSREEIIAKHHVRVFVKQNFLIELTRHKYFLRQLLKKKIVFKM